MRRNSLGRKRRKFLGRGEGVCRGPAVIDRGKEGSWRLRGERFLTSQ